MFFFESYRSYRDGFNLIVMHTLIDLCTQQRITEAKTADRYKHTVSTPLCVNASNKEMGYLVW